MEEECQTKVSGIGLFQEKSVNMTIILTDVHSFHSIAALLLQDSV